jgi:hypothetical protein
LRVIRRFGTPHFAVHLREHTMNMKSCVHATFAAAAIGATVLAASSAQAQSSGASLKDQIVGTWLLVAQYVEQGDKRIERFGSNPKGMVIYEPGGHVASILMRRDLPRVSSNNAMTGTADENKAIIQGSTAFFGRWSVDADGKTIVTQIDGATFPNWDGQAQRRTVVISGDELRSCVPGAQIGGTACSVWRRAK